MEENHPILGEDNIYFKNMDNIAHEIFLLENSNKHLTEFDLKSITNTFDKLTSNDKKRVNTAALKKLATMFDSGFQKFLERNRQLKKNANGIQLAYQIQQAKNGDVNARENIEKFLVNNMLYYYNSLLKKRIFKKSISGNRLIDDAYSDALNKLFKTPEIKELFKKEADRILGDKEFELTELIREKKKTNKVVKNIRKILVSKDKRIKWMLMDEVTKNFKGINRRLKKYIKKYIDNTSKNDIAKIAKNIQNKNKVESSMVKLISPAIINFFEKVLYEKYLDDNEFTQFKKVLSTVLNSEIFEKIFESELKANINWAKVD